MIVLSTEKKEKICFIISTIGSENSDSREKADEKLNYLFKPVLENLNYKVIRSDNEDTPGSISRKIVERIIGSDMVVADITDENPNVFYELAIRNSVNKPIIIIKSPSQKPPFDIQDTRAISVDMTKPKIWQTAKAQLESQIKDAEKDPKQASKSILSDFIPHLKLEKPTDRDSEVLIKLKDIEDKLKMLKPTTYDEPKLVWNPMITTSTNRTHSRLVKCKKCAQKIPIELMDSIMLGIHDDIKLTCNFCKTENAYSSSDVIEVQSK